VDCTTLEFTAESLKNLFAIMSIEVEQHDRGRATAFRVGKLVHIVHGTVAIVDHVQLMGKLMGLKHPADRVDVHRVIFHHDDGQGRTRGRSLHTWNSFSIAHNLS
jgi:hypothetical protein